MDPLGLTSEALREPWRLWTGHLVHFGWEHTLANAFALLVPALLVPREERWRLLAMALLAAPLLSLLLLVGLGQDHYRGASGLACALWAWAGLRLLSDKLSPPVGMLMLGGLLFKLLAETIQSGSILLHPEGWQVLPASHLWGTALGVLAAFSVRLQALHAR